MGNFRKINLGIAVLMILSGSGLFVMRLITIEDFRWVHVLLPASLVFVGISMFFSKPTDPGEE